MHTTSSLLATLAGAALVLASPAPGSVRPAVLEDPIGPFPGGRVFARQNVVTTSSSGPSPTTTDDGALIDLDDLTPEEIACMTDYIDISLTAPTPAPELLEWMATGVTAGLTITGTDDINAEMTSLCEEAAQAVTPPASLSSAWSSYESAGSSWMEAHASSVKSIQSACPGEISAVAGLLVMSDAAACTSVVMGLVEVIHGTATTTADVPGNTSGAGNGGNGGNGNGGENSNDQDGDNNEDEVTTTQSTAGVPGARETGLVAAVAAVAIGVAGAVAF